MKKLNLFDDQYPWQSAAYHLAARYKSLHNLSQELNLEIDYTEIAAGGRILPHQRAEAELLFCLSGTGWFSVDREEALLSAGDVVWLPEESVRGVSNRGEVPLIVLLMRKDGVGEEQIDLTDWLRMLWRG